METNQRTDRLSALFQAELARLIDQELSDPRLGLITITSVNVTPDLSVAKVYLLMHDTKRKKEQIDVLKKASGFLRAQLAKAIDLRKVPELRFYYDDSAEHGARITDLLSQIKIKD